MQCKLHGHQMAPLALVALLALSVSIELVRGTSVKSAKGQRETTRPIVRTPGTPGFDKNQIRVDPPPLLFPNSQLFVSFI